ncbi:thioredoxin family protein [Bacillus niameyensis]|uniref:thioredoxin family protein n=1 Tax=Bacillus niameyensis TaxID=1522308 RepID=UPI0007840ADB|nr:thioredoxin family protein [Bacillus niameyensis]
MDLYSQEDILHILEEKKSAILYFYTPLCGTCQVAGRMLDVVEQMIHDWSFGKSDLNYMPEVAKLFSIESVPCLLVIREGIVLEKIYAFQSVPYLYSTIKAFSE